MEEGEGEWQFGHILSRDEFVDLGGGDEALRLLEKVSPLIKHLRSTISDKDAAARVARIDAGTDEVVLPRDSCSRGKDARARGRKGRGEGECERYRESQKLDKYFLCVLVC